MQRRYLLSRMAAIVLFFPLMLCTLAAASEYSFAAAGTDYVIVIDVSTSMEDIFDEVKKVSKDTINKARAGDNVAVITFGEYARLLGRKQIRDRADIESLKKQVDGLYPTDFTTYINRGMERGLLELRHLFEKNPSRERVLLWLSDDKDNPPEMLGNDFMTLEKLREEAEGFEPEQEWFAYNAPLSEVENADLVDFVTWARRTTYRVAVREDEVKLGSFEKKAISRKIALTFMPKHPGAAGLEFTTSAQITDPKNPSRTIPASVSPGRVVASGNSWRQEFQIAFEGEEPGEYRGFLSFQPTAGTLLDVEPRRVPLMAMLVPPKLVEEPESPGPPIETMPTGTLTPEEIRAEKRPPGMTRPEKPLTFAKLEPGVKRSKIVQLYLNKAGDPNRITHDVSIDLPNGIDIKPRVYGRGTNLKAEIAVAVDKDIELPETFSLQRAYDGTIRFKSDEPGVEVLPLLFPINVTFNTGQGVRWGEKMLAQPKVEAPRARRMTFEELTKELEKGMEPAEQGPIASILKTVLSTVRQRYVFLPLLGAVVAIIIALLYRLRPATEMFTGELVVIKDPSNSNMKNINLKRIGSLHDKNMLTVGTSPKADIRLNHESVAPVHCKISAKTYEHHTDIVIHPMKGHSVRINDLEQTEGAPLSDKDLIGIGNFILLFSRPEARREAVAHFLDGSTLKGTPVTWDIGAPSFELLRSDLGDRRDTAEEEISIVEFAKLKAVFFLKDAVGAGLDIAPERLNKEAVFEVTFTDGEKIEGRPLADYSDVSRRFYIVPEEMPNISSILIERTSVKDIVSRRAPYEPKAAKAGGLMAPFRRGKSATAE